MRMDQMERLRSKDLQEIGRLTQQIDELYCLRAEDAELTDKLKQRIEELYQNCGQAKTTEQPLVTTDIGKPISNTSEIQNLSATEHSSAVPKTKEVDTSSKSDHLERTVSRHYRRITRISPSKTMAFHAIVFNEMNNPSDGMIVKYDRLILNTGGANYNTAITGVFTCTEPGVYVFSWTIFLSGHEYMYTDLVRNGNVIGSAQTGQDTRYTISGAAIAATELDIADKVWVRVGSHSGGADIKPKLSMFTGFRI